MIFFVWTNDELFQTSYNLLRSSENGYPELDSMLVTVFNVRWPTLQREVMAIAGACTRNQDVPKSIEIVLKQKQVDKLPECTESTQEIAINFAGLFQSVKEVTRGVS